MSPLFDALFYFILLLLSYRDIEGALSVSRLSELVVDGEPIVSVTDAMVTSLLLAIPDRVFQSKAAGGASIDFGSDIVSR